MKDVVDSFDATFGTRSAVVAIDEPGGEDRVYPDQVVARLVQNDHESYRRIADFVNAYPCDVLNIQHEYGLFGGDDGEMDRRAHRRRPQTRRHVAAHRAARPVARSSARRARDLRDVQRRSSSSPKPAATS